MELGAGIWSHSLSLLAGAGHLLSDLLTLGLTLFVIWLVQRRPSEQTTHHYQQLEAWVAFLNGVSLGAVALTLVWQSVQRLNISQPILGLPMLAVAILSLVLNGCMAYLLHKDHHNLSVRGIFLHGAADAASALGVMLSALAIYYWQWFWADAAASLFVAVLIGWSAISLIQDSCKAWVNARRNALG